MKHHIERTSPKGGKFIGTCRLCGQQNLTSADALKDCPNPNKEPESKALVDSIRGK